jgi:glucose/arabinose dehydrogenase
MGTRCAVILIGATVAAALVPFGFSQSKMGFSLANPTSFTLCPDDGRIFVSEQRGTLRLVKNRQLLSVPFLSLNVSTKGALGLMGVCCDPNFAANKYVYVYYTPMSTSHHSRVSRFTSDGDVALLGSEAVLLELGELASNDHIGGALHFGVDGKLFISVGDDNNGTNAQSLDTLFGKVLRINADGTIPDDNPFYSSTTGLNRAVWALGLRNPFTFSVGSSGRMFINDVGMNTWEEINDGVPGANYGWPLIEGTRPRSNFSNASEPSFTYRDPVYSYGHGNGATLGCAVTGGVFYEPALQSFPASYSGVYFFGDFCGGWISYIDPTNNAFYKFATDIPTSLDLRVDANGILYFLSRGVISNSGFIGTITYNTPTLTATATVTASATSSISLSSTPSSTSSASSTATNTRTATITATSSSTSTAISTLTGTVTSISSSSSSSTSTRSRTSSSTSTSSNSSRQTRTATRTSSQSSPNTPPTASILSPAAGTFYVAGQILTLKASAYDAQETLTRSRYTWNIVFVVGAASQLFLSGVVGPSASFTVPSSGETATNVYFEVQLTVADSGGLSTTVVRKINPRTVATTITTIPRIAGLRLSIENVPCTPPCVFQSVVGLLRGIGAPATKAVGSRTYSFKKWNDNGALSHNITITEPKKTYTATYV